MSGKEVFGYSVELAGIASKRHRSQNLIAAIGSPIIFEVINRWFFFQQSNQVFFFRLKLSVSPSTGEFTYPHRVTVQLTPVR